MPERRHAAPDLPDDDALGGGVGVLLGLWLGQRDQVGAHGADGGGQVLLAEGGGAGVVDCGGVGGAALGRVDHGRELLVRHQVAQ